MKKARLRMKQNPQPRYVERIAVTASRAREHREVVANALKDVNRIMREIKPLLKEAMKKAP